MHCYPPTYFGLVHDSDMQVCDLARKQGLRCQVVTLAWLILLGTGWVTIPTELVHHTPTLGAISLPFELLHHPLLLVRSCTIHLPLEPYPYLWSALPLEYRYPLELQHHTLPLEYRYPLELLHHTPALGVPVTLGASAPYPWSCFTIPLPLGAAAKYPYPCGTGTPWSCCDIPLPLEYRYPLEIPLPLVYR